MSFIEDYNAQLYHHGIKGQKWGVRRFQNKDGSLTPAGKKRISKQYKKIAVATTKDIADNAANLWVDAYNKSAQEMNDGGIDKFNKAQRKKYGENYAERDGYMSDYEELFDKVMTKNLNQVKYEFMSNNSNYKKSKELVDKYGMTDWDELAKDNESAIVELRKIVEKGE